MTLTRALYNKVIALPRVLQSGMHSKIIQIIQRTCTVFIDNFRNISPNSSISISVCMGSYGGYVKHERNDTMSDPWDPQRNEKCSFYFYCLLP